MEREKMRRKIHKREETTCSTTDPPGKSMTVVMVT